MTMLLLSYVHQLLKNNDNNITPTSLMKDIVTILLLYLYINLYHHDDEDECALYTNQYKQYNTLTNIQHLQHIISYETIITTSIKAAHIVIMEPNTNTNTISKRTCRSNYKNHHAAYNNNKSS